MSLLFNMVFLAVICEIKRIFSGQEDFWDTCNAKMSLDSPIIHTWQFQKRIAHSGHGTQYFDLGASQKMM